MRIFKWVPAGGALVFLLSAIAFGDCGRMGDYGWMNWMMGNRWMLFSFGRIIMWILLVGLIVAVVYLITRLEKNRGAAKEEPKETPLEIVKMRYVRGEISKDEFESLKRDLL